MCTIELMKECAQHGLPEEAKAIISNNPLPVCADEVERDEYRHYRTVLKIDALCRTEECSVILKTEGETTPDTTHCFCVYHPNGQDHSSRQCQEKNLPSILKRHGISVQKRESAYHALLEVTRSGNANPKLQVPAARTVRRIMPKIFPADPNQKKSTNGSAYFIPMHQTTAPPNV